jgi:O-acetyl-ADP-ribose deacetylase (regulator of RNase III)
MAIQLIFTDTNDAVIKALADAFAETDCIAQACTIAEAKGPAVLATAGNSYGIMDGGVDLAVRDLLGTDVEARVQKIIKDEYAGLCPVGSALTVDLAKLPFPVLIYAPTMIVPMSIKKTGNAYLAMYAILAEYTRVGQTMPIICPGLGTLTGKLTGAEAAAQMKLAYDHFHTPYDLTWPTVSERFKALKALL